jgi:hypothetical protein
MEVNGQLHGPELNSGETAPSTHCTGGWMGPKAILDAVENRKISSPYRESNYGHPARNLLLYRLSYPGSRG